jgi:tyrosine-protein kinase
MKGEEKTVSILLGSGADPQLRRNADGWVAMHEAAFRGHVSCVRVLHSACAPLRPRTIDLRLPIHLALQSNHEAIVNFLDSVPPETTAGQNRDSWYHGSLGRAEAGRLLQLASDEASSSMSSSSSASVCHFLVRRHSQKPQVYVLTLLTGGTCYRFEIEREGPFYFIDDGPYLDSLEALVRHYGLWADGLPARLSHPVGPTQTFHQQPKPSSANNTNNLLLGTPPPLPKRVPLPASPNALHRLVNDVANNNNNNSGVPLPPFCKGKISFF